MGRMILQSEPVLICNLCTTGDLRTSQVNIPTFLFERVELPWGFHSVDPEVWDMRKVYKRAAAIIKDLKVVNDHAEREVSLVQKFSGMLTKNEE